MDMDAQEAIGSIIRETWRLESCLGGGGFGQVFCARHVTLDKPFAIKFLHPHLTGDQAFVTRFENEAKTTAALSHPNIVSVTDHGHDLSLGHYIVMELLSGVSLDARIQSKEEEPLTVLESTRIIKEVALGLSYAHANDVIHRDIKSQNIQLCESQGQGLNLKILDFGIAKLMTAEKGLTLAGAVIGSPEYMAPEQACGEDPDARSDLYSLGVVYYECLTGRLPFGGRTPLELMTIKIAQEAPRPTQIDPSLNIPEEVELVVLSLLRRDRTARFQSADELVERLTEVEPSLERGGSASTDVRSAVSALRQKMIDDESLMKIDIRAFMDPEDRPPSSEVSPGQSSQQRPVTQGPAAGHPQGQRSHSAVRMVMEESLQQSKKGLTKWIYVGAILFLVCVGLAVLYSQSRSSDASHEAMPQPASQAGAEKQAAPRGAPSEPAGSGLRTEPGASEQRAAKPPVKPPVEEAAREAASKPASPPVVPSGTLHGDAKPGSGEAKTPREPRPSVSPTQEEAPRVKARVRARPKKPSSKKVASPRQKKTKKKVFNKSDDLFDKAIQEYK
jgi:serine/threonine protein kinase